MTKTEPPIQIALRALSSIANNPYAHSEDVNCAKAAIAAMGDASTRKDEGYAGTTCTAPQASVVSPSPSEISVGSPNYGECLTMVFWWYNEGSSGNLQPLDRLKNVAFHLQEYLGKRKLKPVMGNVQRLRIEKALYQDLCNEKYRLKNFGIVWDIADIMQIALPYALGDKNGNR